MSIQTPSFRDRLKFIFTGKDGAGVGFFDRFVLGGMLGAQGAWVARPDDKREKMVLDILEDLSKERGIATPKLIVYKSDIPNAASIASGNVVIGTNLMDIMTPDQIRAVMGHELSHHRHRSRDLPVMLGMPIAYDVAREVVYHKMENAGMKDKKYAVAFAVVDGVGLVAANIALPLAYMRSLEYEADKEGAELGQPKHMIGALESLQKRSHQILKERNPHFKPHKQSGWMSWLNSHPPTASRIERLKAMEEHPVSEQETLHNHSLSR